MPTRLHLTFPGARGDKDITFVCDSGDYDPGPELDYAIDRVNGLMAAFQLDDTAFPLTLEDV